MSTAIKVENLSKVYRLGLLSGGRLVDDVSRWWARVRGKPDPLLKIGQEDHGNRKDGYIWALKDVSFEVKEGEVLGIIGKNGAGKSTLLKIISRITAPTSGQVKIKGRIGALLEVGTGFHPELTGRENIYLNGAILGMTKSEVTRKFDEIVDFSGVEQFIDTPVKRYSSGMKVRLAFAVAAHLDPEILVIDEVLAVGDVEFQKRCIGKMGEVTKEGRTVLFVSHNMGAVKNLCNFTIRIDGGRIKRFGPTVDIIHEYLRLDSDIPNDIIDISGKPRSSRLGEFLLITSIRWLTGLPLYHGECVRVRICFKTKKRLENIIMGISFASLEGIRLLTYESDFQNDDSGPVNIGEWYVDCEIDYLPLSPGIYTIDVEARGGDFNRIDSLRSITQVEVILGKETPPSFIRKGFAVRLKSKWTWGK